MLSHAPSILAQQGHFTVFAGIYCCAVPLVMAIVLMLIYFGVRRFGGRSDG